MHELVRGLTGLHDSQFTRDGVRSERMITGNHHGANPCSGRGSDRLDRLRSRRIGNTQQTHKLKVLFCVLCPDCNREHPQAARRHLGCGFQSACRHDTRVLHDGFDCTLGVQHAICAIDRHPLAIGIEWMDGWSAADALLQWPLA